MKESYRKGVAPILAPSHARSERGEKADREALTGVRVGWVLSREMKLSSGSRRGQATRKATVLLSITRDSTTLRGQRPQTCSETLVREPGGPGSSHRLRNGGPEGERDER